MRRRLLRAGLTAAALTLAIATPAVAEVTSAPTGPPATTDGGPADTSAAPVDAGAPATTAEVATPTTAAGAAVPAEPNGCAAALWDPLGRLGDTTRLQGAIDHLVATQGLDVHVRIESTTDGGADARQAQLERICPGWLVGGEPSTNRAGGPARTAATRSGRSSASSWSPAASSGVS